MDYSQVVMPESSVRLDFSSIRLPSEQQAFTLLNSTPKGQEMIMMDGMREDSKMLFPEVAQVGVIEQLDRDLQNGWGQFMNDEPQEQPTYLDYVEENLYRHEGEGDNVTDVPTGKLGVTQTARAAVGADESVPDEVVARQYLERLDNIWNNRKGFGEAPVEVKAALLDATYNLGEQILRFPSLAEALEKGDYEKVAKETLDTASTQGMTSKGLARRRAINYNKIVPDKPITEIEQLDDGTIIYRSGSEKVFDFNTEKGKHPTSKTGTIGVEE